MLKYWPMFTTLSSFFNFWSRISQEFFQSGFQPIGDKFLGRLMNCLTSMLESRQQFLSVAWSERF